MISVFIHTSPMILTLALRWHKPCPGQASYFTTVTPPEVSDHVSLNKKEEIKLNVENKSLYFATGTGCSTCNKKNSFFKKYYIYIYI